MSQVSRDLYDRVGYLLDDIDAPAILCDALSKDCPIVGAAPGFCELTGYRLEHLLGRNCRMMLDGVPLWAISDSARKNISNFCKMCRIEGLSHIADVYSVQANARCDGSTFVNFFSMGICKIDRHVLILGVAISLGEGLSVSLPPPSVVEDSYTVLKSIRERLLSKVQMLASEGVSGPDAGVDDSSLRSGSGTPAFAFFHARLQDHCVLTDSDQTAIRREAEEISKSCMVFGDRPMHLSGDGLSFSVRVNKATSRFEGFPFLGFTQRQPEDSLGLYPAVSRCCGSSILIGGCGEAFARDQTEHFGLRFNRPTADQVQQWTADPPIPSDAHKTAANVQPGDVLTCRYFPDGRLRLDRNGELMWEFNTDRPIDESAHYYAVVDVCLSACSITILPPHNAEMRKEKVECGAHQHDLSETDGIMSHWLRWTRKEPCPQTLRDSGERLMSESDSLGTGPPSNPTKKDISMLGAEAFIELPREQDKLHRENSSHSTDSTIEVSTDSHISSESEDGTLTRADEARIKLCIQTAMRNCNFVATLADPRSKDCPLIAVTPQFEIMTGFRESEIIGSNCRFLNQGCDVNPTDLKQLRISTRTGEPYTAVLPNRKKNGELFLNLLDLRGLSVGRNQHTGEDLWFIVGFQSDVTNSDTRIPTNPYRLELQTVASAIQSQIASELSKMAVKPSGSLDTLTSLESQESESRTLLWHVLAEPLWMTRAAQDAHQHAHARADGCTKACKADISQTSRAAIADDKQPAMLGEWLWIPLTWANGLLERSEAASEFEADAHARKNKMSS